MSVGKPVPVPQKEITSRDLAGWNAGLNLNGGPDAPDNAFTDSKDVELSIDGFLIPRRVRTPFLPDTIGTIYHILPVLWKGNIYYFTADNNKIRFCQEGDSTWTDCASPGVAATLTTALTGANNDLTFTAVVLGAVSDIITITYVNPGTPSAALSVSVTGNDITVHLATNSSSVITSTASQVLAAVQASTAATALVRVALASGNTGATAVTALSTTHLAGGSGTNIITTGKGGKPKFLRILDKVLMFNGTNGDKLCYVDLTGTGFPVVKYIPVVDPSVALTDGLSNLTAGSFNVYYAYSYSSTTGETALSPITTISVNIVRDQWGKTPATPGKVTVTRPSGVPANATYWNLYMATAAQYGTIQPSDMLQVASQLDLATNSFVDDGSLSINLSVQARTVNNTDGPRIDHGVEENGNPVLFGDIDNPQNIWIGGGGVNALDFSVAGGGYLAQPEIGTNFTPTAIVGFRNGLGQPSITVLYSNTEGLSKQAVLEQDTVTYGSQTFSVWGVKEQHYGAAGVAATNSIINYNGKLAFVSTDGIMTMNTQPLRQNVIATASISIKAIDQYVRAIKNSAMKEIVGAGWDNKLMWLIPNDGFDTPQQILVSDDNNKTADGDGAWYTLNVPAQWIGVISPQTSAAFVYICQGNKTYKLVPGNSTFDTINGVPVPFSTNVTGPMSGMDPKAHNTWQADVQAMFYVQQLVGDITVGVNYRDQTGKIKTKTKTFHGPVFQPSGAGGWGDPGWSYEEMPSYAGSPPVDPSKGVAPIAVDARIPVQIDDIFNEAQWFYWTPIGFSHYKFRAVSYEGVGLGVRPDLQ